MVLVVAVHPFFRNVCLNNLSGNKCEIKRSNITVMPWESQKLGDYISEIIQIIETPIDYFYVILDDTFLNDFRKAVVEVCKKYKLKHCEIINDYTADAVIALEFMKAQTSERLWIFNCFHRGICCAIWEKCADSELALIEHCHQERITQGDNPTSDELQNLRKEIESAQVGKSSPILVVIQREKQFDEKSYKTAFYGYKNIFFYKQNSFAYSFVENIQNLFNHKINSVLGRNIEIKHNDVSIVNLNANYKIPFENEYEINVLQKNSILKVCEKNLVTEEMQLNEKGVITINFSIDKNGIYNLEVKRKITIWHPFPSNTNPQSETFDIPSKLPFYDSTLNAIGIDLGTLECCAFVIRKNGPDGVVLDEFTAQRTLPSNINLGQLQFYFGQIAVNRMDINAEFSIFDIKQLLGKTFNEIVIDPIWPFKVVDYGNQISLTCGSFDNETLIFGTSTALCSILLKFMKQKIEEYQGQILDAAVITVPSSFTEKQKEATIEAAKIAKWESVKLLPEPFAAAIAYSYENRIPNKSAFLIFDCGGGTTDICIAKVCENEIKIISENGDLLLGGKDFDKLLINYFNSVLKHMYGVNVLETNKRYRLMIKCREIKHTLSTYESDKLDVDDFKFDECSDIPITRKEFEDMTTDLIFRAKNLIAESLRNARFLNAEIDTVFQVGGGCRMPMIKKMLKEMFPNSQHQCSIHPEELVAKGAALYAYSLKNIKQ